MKFLSLLLFKFQIPQVFEAIYYNNFLSFLFSELFNLLVEFENNDSSFNEQPLSESESELENPCCICMALSANYAFVNCGHKIICQNCAIHYDPTTNIGDELRQSRCPLCQTPVQQPPIRIFSA